MYIKKKMKFEVILQQQQTKIIFDQTIKSTLHSKLFKVASEYAIKQNKQPYYPYRLSFYECLNIYLVLEVDLLMNYVL